MTKEALEFMYKDISVHTGISVQTQYLCGF